MKRRGFFGSLVAAIGAAIAVRRLPAQSPAQPIGPPRWADQPNPMLPFTWTNAEGNTCTTVTYVHEAWENVQSHKMWYLVDKHGVGHTTLGWTFNGIGVENR